MLNKIILRGAIVSFVVVGAALIVPSFVNWNSYKGTLLNQINVHTGLVVSVDGPIKFSLFPSPHLILSDLTVQNKQVENTKNQLPPLIKLKHLSLYVDMLPLFEKKISISSVELIKPFVFIENEEALKTESARNSIGTEQQNPVAKENASQQLSLNIKHLSVVDGTIILSNTKEKSRNEIQKINLSGAFGFDKGFDLKVAIDVNGVSMKGLVKGGAFIEGMPQTFDAVLDVANGDIKGKITASGAMKDGGHVLSAKSDAIKLPLSFSIGDYLVDCTKGLSFNANMTFKDEMITIENLSAKLADIALTSKGSYQLKESKGELSLSLASSLLNASGKIAANLSHVKPMLTVDLIIPKLDEQSWVKSIMASDSTKSSQSSETQQKTGNERWSNEPIDLKALQILDADVSLSIDTLKLSGVDASAVKLHLNLNNGTAKIKQLTFNVFGGNTSFSGVIHSHTANLNIVANMMGLDIKKLPGMKDSPVKSGRLNASANFATNARSMYTLVQKLSGKGHIQIDKGIVEAFDIEQFIADLKAKDVSKLKGGFDRKKNISFNHIRGDFTLTNGIANTQNCEIDFNEGGIITVGTINLPDWTLALTSTLNVRADKNIPSLACNITGSLDSPSFALDMGSLQKELVKTATNQLADRAKAEVQKSVKKHLGDVIQGGAANNVGKEVSNALGKLLPGLLG
ncbi:MAG: AsmA family protein [Candidatus Paracaedibacteraceae bacterium]|nr:AsmA family protein [Candidatus Paracaedibacteraceae bacterium]